MNLPYELRYLICCNIDQNTLLTMRNLNAQWEFLITDEIAPWSKLIIYDNPNITILSPLCWTHDTKVYKIFTIQFLFIIKDLIIRYTFVTPLTIRIYRLIKQISVYIAELTDLDIERFIEHDLVYRLIDARHEPYIYQNKTLMEVANMYKRAYLITESKTDESMTDQLYRMEMEIRFIN